MCFYDAVIVSYKLVLEMLCIHDIFIFQFSIRTENIFFGERHDVSACNCTLYIVHIPHNHLKIDLSVGTSSSTKTGRHVTFTVLNSRGQTTTEASRFCTLTTLGFLVHLNRTVTSHHVNVVPTLLGCKRKHGKRLTVATV